MDIVTVAIGIAALGYGGYTLKVRRSNPAALGKLEPMKRMWGEILGTAIHVIAYTVVPIVLGVAAILAGLKGTSICSW